MEYVGARKLFSRSHGVPADDARVLALRQLIVSRRGEALFHRRHQSLVPEQTRFDGVRLIGLFRFLGNPPILYRHFDWVDNTCKQPFRLVG